MNPNQSKLAIGYLDSDNFERSRRGIVSLRKSGFNGEIWCLMDHTIQDEHLRRLTDLSVLRIPIEQSDLHPCLHGSITKFLSYRLLLEKLSANPPGCVIIADFDNLIFQGDLTRYLKPEALSIFTTGYKRNIATSKNARKWLYYLYGTKALWEIAKSPAIFPGLLVGPLDQLHLFLEQIRLELLKFDHTPLLNCDVTCGIIHYLICNFRSNKFNLDICWADEGPTPVLCLEHMVQEEIRFSVDGKLLSINGTVPALITSIQSFPVISNYFYSIYQ